MVTVHEGVTPAVAVVVLTLMVVAGGSTVYYTLNQGIGSTSTDVKFNPNVLSVESCYSDSQAGTVNVSLRNTGGDQINITRLDLVIEGDTLQNSEYDLSKNTVNPGKLFQIGIYPDVYRDTEMKFVTHNNEKPIVCPNLENKPSGAGPSPGPSPSPGPDLLPEIGGAISELFIDGNLTADSGQVTCLGNNCGTQTGGSPTSFDTDDDDVDRSGDVMSGYLETSKVVKDGNLMCLGDLCNENTGSLSGHLSDSNPSLEGFLRIENLTFSGSSGCIGGNC